MEKRSRARPSWGFALLMTALLCFAAFFVAKQFSESATLDTAILLPCETLYAIEPLGNGVLYSDGTNLHALGPNGQQTWWMTVGSGFGFAVGDGGVSAWSGRTLSLMESGGGTLLFTGTLPKVIRSAYLGKTYAAVLAGEEDASTMYVLERGGAQIDEIDLSGVTVLDYGFFNGGNMLWVLTLNTEGTVPVSSVSTYVPAQRLAGTINESDQLVYKVLFQSTQIRTVGTLYSRSHDYTGTETLAERVLIYGWSLVATGGSADDAMLLLAPDEQAARGSISDLRLIRGTRETRRHLPFSCFAVAMHGDTLYGFTGPYVVRASSGEETAYTREMPVVADAFYGLTEGGSAIVASEGRVYLVPLK